MWELALQWAQDWAWAGAGVAMVGCAVCWRIVRRRRIRSRLEVRLADADPARRRAAVEVATEQGLRTHAAMLVALLDREQHTGVLDALAAGVLRSAWEPADRPDLLRLRLWAHEHRGTPAGERGPDTGTVADAERTVALHPVVPRVPIAPPLPRRTPQVWTEPGTVALPPVASPTVAARRAAHLAPDTAPPTPPRGTPPRHRATSGFRAAPQRGAYALLSNDHLLAEGNR
ncbi:carbamoylphosphate synthase large subunit, short form [Pseudonocardia sp. N23]|nr:carbamoylphosphate synthase large subunit, short form [Pseudonocardia sp. N23]